jgi:8-hydroxy-5-deazaflavin:NADPH oxidoreductase
MDITVVGTGNMGRAITTRLVTAGHNVTLHGKTREEAETLARELVKQGIDGDALTVGASGDAIPGEVVVLAVWYDDIPQVVTAYGDQLAGKVVVDITNPVDRATSEPLTLPAGSAAQEIAGLLPESRVVKAFNTTFAGTLTAGQVSGETLDVFVAADDDDAKWTVTQLIEDAGLRAIDVGPLRRAHQVEGLQYLHVVIQDALGTGNASTIKVLP